MRSGSFKTSFAEHLVLVDTPAQRIWYALVLAVLIALPFFASAYTVGFFITALYTLVAALGLNILTGYTGLISLGTAAFLMLGAYGYAVGVTRLGLPASLAFLLAGIVPAAAGLLVGLPSLRLKGIYLAITTLAFSFMTTQLILFGGDFTGGAMGILVDRPEVLGVRFEDDNVLYWFSLFVAVVTLLVVLNIRRSRLGRAFMAIRDNDTAALSMGISLTRYKLMSFVISSFFIGVAGALMLLFINVANVEGFPFLLSIESVAILIVGGLGSILGAVLGTLFILALPEVSTWLLGTISALTGWQMPARILELNGVLYGASIILFLTLNPHGLVGVWADFKRLWVNRPMRF